MSVPIPDATNATGIVSTVSEAAEFTKIGTKIVAPNIAKTCCIANTIHLAIGGFSKTSNVIFFFIFFLPLGCKNFQKKRRIP